MKKLAVTDKSACMTCMTCELACAKAFYKNDDVRLSCIQIGEKEGKTTIAFCVQCGKCAKACESEAITANPNGVYLLNKKKCINCGKCIEACPFHVIVRAEGAASPSKCIACGICVKACPQSILQIKES
ncbi:4Fe-4S ferredoxin [Spirochaetia bacterium]|nr:4Fe-4S ferredoxin [Spirochaetia bacterium]